MKNNNSTDTGFDHEFLGRRGKSEKSNGKVEENGEYHKSLGMIGRFPNFNRGKKLSRVCKANRYLAFQENRISEAIKAGQIRKAVIVGLCLLKVSSSYQTLLFNRVTKVGYWKGSHCFTEETLLKTMNKLRSGDMTLLIRRFYILKKNGKLRPIGAPNGESRVISKAMTDLVYAISESDRSTEQHGYIKNRGSGSAILQILTKLKEGYDGYEFDLKSFFNTVEPFIYFRKLEEKSKILAYVVSSMIKRIVYRWRELELEAELRPKPGRRNTYVRRGVPQGLSLSPLLSTGSLEYFGRPENLVMYADDGIYFYRHNPSKFFSGMERMERAGIRIAPEKSKAIGNEFDFCGVTFNRKEKTIEYNGRKKGGFDTDLEFGVKTVGNKYGKISKAGSGKINKDSYITFLSDKLTSKDKMLIIGGGLGNCSPYKGYRFMIESGRIVDVLSSSSRCCEQLLGGVQYNRPRLASVKPFILDDKIAFDYAPLRKGEYKNYYNNGNGENPNKNEYGEIMEGHDLKRNKFKPIFE